MAAISVIKDVLVVGGMPIIFLFSFILLSFTEVRSQTTLTLCPDQFVAIGRKCYYFSTDELPWQEAYYKCQSFNKSMLAVVTKSHQESRIRNHLNKRPDIYGKYQRWLGGWFDWKRKKWVWAASGKPLEFHAFSRMNANKGNWDWHCIIVDPERQNKWSSRSCFLKKRYICQTASNGYKELKQNFWQNFNKSKCYDVSISSMEKKLCVKYFNKAIKNYPIEPSAIVKLPFQNRTRRKNAYIDFICPKHMILVGRKCYYFSTDKLVWNDAYWACHDNATKLAIINNEHQDTILRGFLNEKFVPKHERWTGGIFDYKQRVWKWAISGLPIMYQNFGINKTMDLDEWYSLTLDPQYDHRWNFKKQFDKKHYICQSKAKSVVKYGKFYKYKPNATVIIRTTNNSVDNNNYKYSRIRRTTPRPSFFRNNTLDSV